MTPGSRTTHRLILLAVFAVIARPAPAAPPAAPPATAPTSPGELFAPNRVHTLEIQMPADRWKLLEPGAGSRVAKPATQPSSDAVVALRAPGDAYAYVRADVQFDGQTVGDVGIRYKGNMSYSVSASTARRPMKIDFDRFVPGQRFAKLETINLNNQSLDPSQAREALAYELFREMGVPSPRTSFALVYLTVPGQYAREFLGLYTLLEEVDHKFLKKHFDNDDGLLLKPVGMRGLACFGDDWAQYQGRCRPRGKVDPALAKRIVELAKLIHRADDATFAKEIARFLDVEEFLGYVLVNGALCNFDSFLSTGHNYYIYVNPADGRASFLPWDMNMAFGGYTWVGTNDQIADVSITHPYVDYNRLIERVLAIDAYRQTYRRQAQKLIAGPFAPDRMRRRLDEIGAIVHQAGDAATRAGKADSPATRPATFERLDPPDMLTFVQKRVASIAGQLKGDRPGYIPAFRDPDVVLREWIHVVRPAAALLDSLDADHDGRLSEAEVATAANKLFTTPLDLDATTTVLEKSLTSDMRKCGTPRAWAEWLLKVADANHDARLDAAEIIACYRRLLAGADMDFDGMMAGREMIEAISSTGAPDQR
jgi:spore coat protein CotH